MSRDLRTGLNLDKDERDPTTLSQLFDNAFELFNNINKSQEPTNSPKIQVFMMILKVFAIMKPIALNNVLIYVHIYIIYIIYYTLYF